MNIRNTNLKCRHQRGMTLVEILVALAISGVLLAGVMQIFVSSKQTYRFQESMARLQENGRFAIDFITRELRMAGYTGCYNQDPASMENILNDSTNFSWDINNLLQGYEATSPTSWTPTLDTGAINAKGGTDVIAIRYMSSDSINLAPPNTTEKSAQLFLATGADGQFAIGEILMVSDCGQASVFQVTNFQTAGGKVNVVHSNSGTYTPGNSTPNLSMEYGIDAEIARLETGLYYITDASTTGEPTLIYESLTASGGTTSGLTATELIEGVENFQVLYGEDLTADGAANTYTTANAVTNMANVISIRVSLLIRSEDNVMPTPQAYTFNGATITPTDTRVRRIFTSTIKLRNRGRN